MDIIDVDHLIGVCENGHNQLHIDIENGHRSKKIYSKALFPND